MGVSRPTVSNRLGSEKGPPEDFIKEAALIMGVSYEELIQLAWQEKAEAAEKGITLADPIVRATVVPWVSDKLKAQLGID
jgi:hypothetical protein